MQPNKQTCVACEKQTCVARLRICLYSVRSLWVQIPIHSCFPTEIYQKSALDHVLLDPDVWTARSLLFGTRCARQSLLHAANFQVP